MVKVGKYRHRAVAQSAEVTSVSERIVYFTWHNDSGESGESWFPERVFRANYRRMRGAKL